MSTLTAPLPKPLQQTGTSQARLLQGGRAALMVRLAWWWLVRCMVTKSPLRALPLLAAPMPEPAAEAEAAASLPPPPLPSAEKALPAPPPPPALPLPSLTAELLSMLVTTLDLSKARGPESASMSLMLPGGSSRGLSLLKVRCRVRRLELT